MRKASLAFLVIVLALVSAVRADEPVKVKVIVPVGVEVVVEHTGPVDPPPPVTKGPYYFQVVRADTPDGNTPPEFTKVMEDPAWTALRKDGHRVKAYTFKEYAATGWKLPNSTVLPTVVTVKTDFKTSTIVVPAKPLPTTTAGILKLAEVPTNTP